MRHVTQLSPDYIKIDRSLIHDIHLDYAKRALVRSMVTLEKDLGAAVVAEGIESTEELRTLRELVQKTEKDMLETKNFGRKSLNEIKDILREKGLAFGMKLEAPSGAGR